MAYAGRILSNALLLHAKTSAREPWSLYPEHRPAKRPAEPVPHPRDARTKSTYNKWRRACMFKRDPLCHWCRIPMVLVERTKGVVIDSVPNEATIDHLDPRGSPERGKHGGEIRQVLACWSCNAKRNDEFQSSIPTQTWWERDRRRFIDIAKRSGALNEVT